MHELSIAENIRDIVLEAADKAGAQRVSRVVLDIGRLSGIERDALAFGLSVVMKNTIAENAEMVMNDIVGRAHCAGCGQDSVISDFFSLCPFCNSHELEILAGKEMRVSKIDVETDDDN